MTFIPPLILRNPHINTILGSLGPRKWLLKSRSKALSKNAREMYLECSNGVRLHGEYSANETANRGLVIMIHGWEGCATSSYLLSTASHLYQHGFSIFRLHLRDHGPTHHLNREPFLAIRLAEVLEAIEQIQAQLPHAHHYLVGYSLGGNIAVRVAAHSGQHRIRLDKVVAVCPPIDPKAAGDAISKSPIYNRYFVRKWRKSFKKKIVHFPEHQANADIFERRDLIALHEAFVPRYSVHPNATSYFNAYALNAQTLPTLAAPCHIILAADDPVIPIDSAEQLPELDELTLEVTRYGGHCGFLQDHALNTWVDGRIEALLKPRYSEKNDSLA